MSFVFQQCRVCVSTAVLSLQHICTTLTGLGHMMQAREFAALSQVQQRLNVDHPLLNKVRSCSDQPEQAAEFFSMMLSPWEDRETAKTAQTVAYLGALQEEMIEQRKKAPIKTSMSILLTVPRPPPPAASASCHEPVCMSSHAVITCCHHKLSSHAVITCCRHMLSSHAIITCCHHMLSSHAVITCGRHMLSSTRIFAKV